MKKSIKTTQRISFCLFPESKGWVNNTCSLVVALGTALTKHIQH